MTMSLPLPYRRKLKAIEANTTRQRHDAEKQLREVAKIVRRAEVLATTLREAAENFTKRERPEGLK